MGQISPIFAMVSGHAVYAWPVNLCYF